MENVVSYIMNLLINIEPIIQKKKFALGFSLFFWKYFRFSTFGTFAFQAQRSGENTENIKPLFTLEISHAGVWNGPLLQSEFVAAMTAIFVWWSAYTARSRLQQ